MYLSNRRGVTKIVSFNFDPIQATFLSNVAHEKHGTCRKSSIKCQMDNNVNNKYNYKLLKTKYMT